MTRSWLFLLVAMLVSLAVLFAMRTQVVRTEAIRRSMRLELVEGPDCRETRCRLTYAPSQTILGCFAPSEVEIADSTLPWEPCSNRKVTLFTDGHEQIASEWQMCGRINERCTIRKGESIVGTFSTDDSDLQRLLVRSRITHIRGRLGLFDNGRWIFVEVENEPGALSPR